MAFPEHHIMELHSPEHALWWPVHSLCVYEIDTQLIALFDTCLLFIYANEIWKQTKSPFLLSFIHLKIYLLSVCMCMCARMRVHKHTTASAWRTNFRSQYSPCMWASGISSGLGEIPLLSQRIQCPLLAFMGTKLTWKPHGDIHTHIKEKKTTLTGACLRRAEAAVWFCKSYFLCGIKQAICNDFFMSMCPVQN